MLSIDRLDIRYGDKHLFRDLSAVIHPGDRIGLVGVNGAGKSTLLKIMAGHLAAGDGIVRRAKQISVGYLPQEPSVLRSERTLYDEAERSFGEVLALQREAERLHDLLGATPPESDVFSELLGRQGEVQQALENSDIYTIRARVEKVLFGLGFGVDDLVRPVAAFSGGWVMRLLLAKMLLASPSLLLLDEPTNHLDLDSLTWLESFLAGYEGAMMIISHDRAFLDRTTSATWELSLGKLTCYHGNYSRYLRDKEERRRIEKAAYDNQQAQIRQTMRFVERFRAKSTKARQVQSRLKQLDRLERIELAEDEHQIHFSFPPAPHSGRDVLMAEGLGKSFAGETVFRSVDLHLQRGDKVAVVGVNGAGKSTLLRILAGQMEPDHGARRLGAGVVVTYFGQHQAQELAPDFTVFESLSQMAGDMTVTGMRSLLGAFLFRGDDVDKKVAVLSGGEKSRLALARMIARPANCMLLDEPTNHLDMQSQEILEEAMRQYDGTVVVVSHNRYFLDRFVTRVLELKSGTATMFDGTVAEYLLRQQAQRVDGDGGGDRDESSSPESGRAAPSRKEKRRREARQRQQRQELLGPWLKKAAEAERRVDLLEREKAELETKLADPRLYQDQHDWQEASRQYEACTRRLDRWLGRWEEAQARIDSLDRQEGDE